MRAFLTCLLLLPGCTSEPLDPPERPEQVPESAVWAGGLKRGFWFQCEGTDAQGLYSCTIYNEDTGQAEQSGIFEAPGRSPLDEPLEFSTFTGYDIVLVDGSRLKPTFDPFPEDSEPVE